MSAVLRAIAGVLALAASGGVITLVACNDVGTTNYGDPSALRTSTLPGDGGQEAVICGDAAIEASGAGGCAVSFSKDIYPSMTANGTWKCASAGKCHGAQQAPVINATSPQTVIDSLKNYRVNGNPNPYINQDASDPALSAFECNLNGQCGSGMPIDPGKPLTPEEVCRIDAWLRCGAPSN